MAEESLTNNSYDVVPYKSHPFPQSHPDRLATIATLFGMTPQPIDHCRVLEIGCSTGGNLLPVAERFPESQFVGVDLSKVQIDEGQATIQAVGLKNVELLHKDVMDISPDFGQFDYIIAHGVYSWVPKPVQEKILDVCSKNLRPNGVAYVSYNTYPGWHMRGMIRDMMLYRAQGFANPMDRIRHSRALLDFLVQSVPTEDNAFGILLKSELNVLRGQEDYYLFHDHLEETNEPVYFHQFVERLETKGLQYLGETDLRVMSSSNLSRQVETTLQSVATNLIEMEQYMDFVRNRMFRQTLLCHKNITLDRQISPDNIRSLYVSSSAKPENPVVNLQSNEQTKFVGPSSMMSTSERIVKAAMLHLGEAWPKSVSFLELLAMARSRLNPEPVVVDIAHSSNDARALADPMIRCYATMHVELSAYPVGFTLERSERPRTTALVRHQSAAGNRVTNRRHESVILNDLQRHIVGLLDGNNTRDMILDRLVALVTSAVLVIHDNGQHVIDENRTRPILAKALEQSLVELAPGTVNLSSSTIRHSMKVQNER